MTAGTSGKARHYLWELRPYFRQVGGELLLGSLAGIVMNTTVVLPALLLGHAIDTVLALQRGEATAAAVGRAVLLLFAGTMASEGPRMLKRWWLGTANARIRANLRADAVRGILARPLAELHGLPIGDLMARVIGDVEILGVGVREFVIETWDTVLFSLSFVVAMLFLDAPLTGLALASAPLALLLGYATGRGVARRTTAERRAYAALTGLIQEQLAAIRLLRLFGRGDAAVAQVAALARAQADANLRVVRLLTGLQPVYQLLITGGVVLLIWRGGVRVIAGGMTVGAFVAFLQLYGRFIGRGFRIPQLVNSVQSGGAAYARLKPWLAPPLSLGGEPAHASFRADRIVGLDRPVAPPPPVPPGPIAVDVRDVTFAFPGADAPALRGISLAIPAGALVAVTGPVGAGKSALAQVLAGLLPREAGDVLLDGRPIEALPPAERAARIGLLPQEPFLFSGTVRENVLLVPPDTVPGATERRAVAAAVDLAALGEDLATFPDGLEQQVGELGIRVSGGQRQRIALARAVAAATPARPGLLVLDDPFSAVDVDTEAHLLAGLREAFGPAAPPERRATIVLCSHRLTAFPQADTVLVLDRGAHGGGRALRAHLRRAATRGGAGRARGGAMTATTTATAGRDPLSASGREMRAVLGPVLRPWRGVLAFVALGMVLARALELIPALLVQRVVDRHLTPGHPDGLLALGLLYLGAVFAAQAANFVAIYLAALVAQNGLRALRVRLAAHLQRLPLGFYDRTPIGDVISRCTADVETVETLFTTGAIDLVGNLARLLTACGAMLLLSRPLTLVALLTVPPLVAITRFFQRQVRAAERHTRRGVGLMNTHLQETLAGADTIRAFGREATFTARFRRALHVALLASNRSTLYSSLYTPTMVLLAAATTALLLWAGGAGFTAAWGVSLGTLTAFVLVFGRFFDPITAIGDDWQTVQSALAGVERVVQVLALPGEERPVGRAAGDGRRGGLALRDVVFGYRPGHPVVRGVSFTVRPGEQVALVGRTVAGKTSIVQLIAGLYPAWAGAVAVAGRDPRTLADEERRAAVAIVPQQVQLFSATVRENLTLGDPTVPHAALARAVGLAGARGLIDALPQGYDTPLQGAGRGAGAQLSAGQRQLLALARALVWDPAVLLLDEATVALDSASDAALWSALRADVGGSRRAVLTVAHRLATARAADRVIVLDAGRVVEEGPPDDLIRRGGRFAALVELEAAGWDWREA